MGNIKDTINRTKAVESCYDCGQPTTTYTKQLRNREGATILVFVHRKGTGCKAQKEN